MFDENEQITALEKEIEELKQKLDLIGKVDHYKASLIHTYHFAGQELLKCGTDRYMASGLIIEIRNISGKNVVMPFMIKNGLSNNTINALLDDMQATYDDALTFKPIEKRLK